MVMSDAVKPGREWHAPEFVGWQRFYRVEEDLLRHVLGLGPVAYLDGTIPVDLVEIVLI